MKKCLSVLLAVLMLLSILPFSFAVSAADEPTIMISCEEEEVNAGEEIKVTVNLENLDDPGLIGAQVEIGFDPDVFELVTYYDEDEEMWMPPIEVGPKFSASSNKYITFASIDEETGYMERCLVQFLRATATATQAVKTSLFYTVTFKVKDDAVSGDYELYVKDYDPRNIVAYGNVAVDCALESTSVTVNGIPRCEHRWNDATCTEPATCTLCGDTDGEALGHSYGEGEVTRVPTCTIAGVMTYTCSKCEHSYTETIATVDHSYGEGGATQNPYCTVCGALSAPTIMISCEEEEVNAGEEIKVTVNLENLDDPGLVGAQVEIGFDPDVFELVTYYDEDEEMWMPPIEVGPKFSASHNKYITFASIDEETGYMERCLVRFLRATATATQAVKTSLFYTVTFKVKDDAVSGDYELYVKDYDPGNIVAYGNVAVDCALESTSVTVNGIPRCEHEYVDVETVSPTCTTTGVMTYTCSKCGSSYTEDVEALGHNYSEATETLAPTCTTAGEKQSSCSVCGDVKTETVKALGHSYGEGVVTRVPTCATAGVMTYTCSKCEHSYTETIATVDHSYGEGGATQNPYCTVCGALSAPTIMISCEDEEVNAGEEIKVTVNLENLDDPGLIFAQVEIGFDPDVFELVTYYDEDEEMWMPMIEVGPKFSASSNKYITFASIDEETGYMERCLVQFRRVTATATQAVKTSLFYTVTFKVKDDAVSGDYELYVKDYDPRNIIAYRNVAVDCALESTSVTVNGIPRCEHKYDSNCDVDCNECGAIRDADDHTYYDEYDVKCDVCGAIREVDIIHYDHEVLYSIMDTESGNGLAFRFSLATSGMQVVENTKADYTNATVRYFGQNCKLLAMGAVVTNQFSVGSKESAMNLDNVNGSTVINIPTVYLCDLEPDSCAFATRIINIPNVALDYPIYARPYYVIEVDGQEVTIYGEINTSSCREVLDGNG